MFNRNGLVFCYLLLFAFGVANVYAAVYRVQLSNGILLTFHHADEAGLTPPQLADLISSAANATEYSKEEFQLASIQEGLKSMQLLNSARFDAVDRLAVVAYGKTGRSINNFLRPNAGIYKDLPVTRSLSNQIRRQLMDGVGLRNDFVLEATRNGNTLDRFKHTLLRDDGVRVSEVTPDDVISVIKSLDGAIAEAPRLVDQPYLYRAALVRKGVMDSAIRPGSYVADFGFTSTTSDIRSLKWRYTPAGGGASDIHNTIDSATQEEVIYTIETNPSSTKALNISSHKSVTSIERSADGQLGITPTQFEKSGSEYLLPRESRFRVKAISEPVDVPWRNGTYQRRYVVLEHIPDDVTIDNAEVLAIHSGERMEEFPRLRPSGACGP